MPKQTYTLNDFSGGLNTVKDPRDIAPNELALAENIMVDEQGAIRTVGKWIDHAVVQDQIASLVGGYGLAILESDYETEPISITGSSNIDFAQLKDTHGSVVATTDTARYVTRAVNNSAMSESGDVLTVTTHTVHQITAGDSIEIRNTTNNYQEGVYTVASVPSTTQYTVESTDNNIPSAFGATFHRLGLAIAASGGGMGFVEGSEILITGTTNNNGHYTVKSTAINNTQLIVQKDFTSEANSSAVITSLPKEDYFLILSDADNGKIDTYSKNRDTWTADQITIDSTGGELVAKTKPVYYSVDNAIRASDANFDLGNNTRWFGYVKRTHFEGCTAEDKYLDWFEKDNKLSPPTNTEVADTYPIDGLGLDLHILTPANSDSTWVAATYQVAISFIYDDNQESLLYIPSSANTFAVAAGDSVTVSVHATSDSTAYNPRISGGRVYARVSGSDESWFLLCDVDMRSGARATLDGDYIAWTNGGSAATQIDTGVVTSLFQNIDTYESLNGYNHDIESNSIGAEGEQWKSAVVANKRAFLAGVRRIDGNTGLHTTYGDRIYYSEAVRYDTFPSHNYIDVVLGDSESYVDIESFADRLLAFKQNSVQVINVASSTDTGWFLEENLKYHGIRHPAASTKTEYGIAWINDSGCYLYDGRRVRNLIDNKIDDDEWSDFIGITAAHVSIIGYERHKKQLIIMKDCTGAVATGGDAYLYDFKTKSWVKLIDAFTDSIPYSNFVHDWDGNLVIAKEHASNGKVEFYTWDSDDVYGTNPVGFVTKDLDFGDPNRTKKIYNVYVTYKANENLQEGGDDIPLMYAKDGSTSFVNFDTCVVDGSSVTTYLPASAANWNVATFGLSSIQSVQSLKLKLDVDSASSRIHINDISIEYRPISKRFT